MDKFRAVENNKKELTAALNAAEKKVELLTKATEKAKTQIAADEKTIEELNSTIATLQSGLTAKTEALATLTNKHNELIASHTVLAAEKAEKEKNHKEDQSQISHILQEKFNLMQKSSADKAALESSINKLAEVCSFHSSFLWILAHHCCICFRKSARCMLVFKKK